MINAKITPRGKFLGLSEKIVYMVPQTIKLTKRFYNKGKLG